MRPWIGAALAALVLTGCGRQPNLLAEPPTRALAFAAAPGVSETMSGVVGGSGRLTEFSLTGSGFDPGATYSAWLRDDPSGDRRVLILEGFSRVPVSAAGEASYDVLLPADWVAPWEAVEIYRHAPGVTTLDGAQRVLEAPLPPETGR